MQFVYPASTAQERLWLADQRQPGNRAYNLADFYVLRGALDAEALRRSLRDLVARHAPLRTTFALMNGRLVQLVDDDPEIEIVCEEEPRSREQAIERAAEIAWGPYDLSNGPPCRFGLIEVGAEEHVLTLCFHHIAFDGWSTHIVNRELSRLYAAHAPGDAVALPPLPTDYPSVAVAERRWLAALDLSERVSRLRAGLDEAPYLTLETARNPTATEARAAHAQFDVRGPVLDRVDELAKGSRCSRFTIVMAAFSAVLSSYVHETDLVSHLLVHGRSHEWTEPLVGFFVNIAPVRIDLSGDPGFGELVGRVRRALLHAQDHQEVPFQELVRGGKPDDQRATGFSPVTVQSFGFPVDDLRLGGVELDLLDVPNPFAEDDLSMHVSETGGTLTVRLSSREPAFAGERLQAFGGHVRDVLLQGARDADTRFSSLRLVDRDDDGVLGVARGKPRTPGPLVLEMVERRAAGDPDRVAVAGGSGSLTFRELDRAANGIAHHLHDRGVLPEQRIGVDVSRGPALLATILGIWKAGAAYLPIDSAQPPARVHHILRDADPPLIVTDGAEPRPTDDLAGIERVVLSTLTSQGSPPAKHRPAPDHAAYTLYTSGSSGTPKGVTVEHRSVANLATALGRLLDAVAPAPLRVSLNAAVTFDASIQQIVLTAFGHTLEIIPEPLRRDPPGFVAYVAERGIEVLDCTPSHLRALIGARLFDEARELKALLVGGEPIDARLWNDLAGRSTAIKAFNVYGLTECTVDSTVAEIRPGSEPNIGRPIDGTGVYVLDTFQRLLPLGCIGEIFIGGAGVARGYVNRPALTDERFVESPFRKRERLFRTGDLGRYREDGQLEFLGRVDRQIKVRGFRVEPEEIEHVLKQHAQVTDAVVLQTDDPTGSRLVAFVVTATAGGDLEAGLRKHLAGQVPNYMFPSSYVFLEELPLTPSGKTDAQRLIADFSERVVAVADDGDGDVTSDAGDLRATVLAIWRRVLLKPQLGADDDFFAVGGHSLMATSLVALLRETLDADSLSVGDIFDYPTVDLLLHRLEQLQNEARERR